MDSWEIDPGTWQKKAGNMASAYSTNAMCYKRSRRRHDGVKYALQAPVWHIRHFFTIHDCMRNPLNPICPSLFLYEPRGCQRDCSDLSETKYDPLRTEPLCARQQSSGAHGPMACLSWPKFRKNYIYLHNAVSIQCVQRAIWLLRKTRRSLNITM